ncbi:MAG: hypothetical protein JJT90_11160 [Ectothiorhodospiraceae bacterium]|nr:hypothetical protein [Ectothiorhodospiraceae bacterium]
MKFAHFVITPFCIRDPVALRKVRGGGWLSDRDPLQEEFVKGKMDLVEILSASSLAGQTLKNFIWIVVVDKDLKESHRKRLRDICKGKVELVIHDYDDGIDWSNAGWLARYMAETPDFLLTTQLDDDDAIPVSYIEMLQKAANECVMSEEAPVMRVYGCKDMWDWTHFKSKRYPLGVKSVRSGAHKVSSCGLSVLCKYPEASVTVLQLRHKLAEKYLDFSIAAEEPEVNSIREKVRSTCKIKRYDPQMVFRNAGFVDIGPEVGATIISNHLWNVQEHRRNKKKVQPERVLGPGSFPNHSLDWASAESYFQKMEEERDEGLFVKVKRRLFG